MTENSVHLLVWSKIRINKQKCQFDVWPAKVYPFKPISFELLQRLSDNVKKKTWVHFKFQSPFWFRCLFHQGLSPSVTEESCLFSLTIKLTIIIIDDMIDLSLTRPHQFSFWKEYLLNMRSDPIQSRICKQRVLCQTLAGNLVYVLTVTNPSRRPADAEVKYEIQNPKWETSSSFKAVLMLSYLCLWWTVSNFEFLLSSGAKEILTTYLENVKLNIGVLVWKQSKQQTRKRATTFLSLDWKRILD